ncbi:UNVERIFIED_CONTAM: Auxin response factor 18 [Sesamum radiatum]|uniref:Auxin response factor n=1 Tax=Sesamum radiatum TaxID=300843 RepID=A0AAW2NB48_SESRA
MACCWLGWLKFHLNSKVYYFPQGHSEHANKAVDFHEFPRISPLIPCRVSSISYLADSETDEVYAKMRLVPLGRNECDVDDEGGLMGFSKNDEKEKPNSFAKTLTQSDANNGGGFSAEILHIYRGTPRRHLLTTGWSNFVNQKKLVAGDSIVFLRTENGDLCVGIQRAKTGISSGPEVVSGWSTGAANCASALYKGFSGFPTSLASSGRPFEVVYYPRASTPEFVVRASAVRAAMRIQWCAGMRFKMAFETEDSSRISWFMGTVSSVQVDDPVHWPNSPWRLLQVAWDEPELLQNVKRVNPWLVELVSHIPAIPLSPFSPPRKRPRPPEFPLGQLHIPMSLLRNPLSPSSPLCCLPDNISSGIQGARHAQFLLSSSDPHFNNLRTGLHPFNFKPPPKILTGNRLENSNFDPLSCSLKTTSSTLNLNKNDERKSPVFLLFGQPILTEQQISRSCSMDTEENMGNVSNGSGSAVIQNSHPEPCSDGEFPRFKDQKLELGLETTHCKVFLESEDVGRTLDLSSLSSYEELYRKLSSMFGLQRSDTSTSVVYSDAAGATRPTGDVPFR